MDSCSLSFKFVFLFSLNNYREKTFVGKIKFTPCENADDHCALTSEEKSLLVSCIVKCTIQILRNPGKIYTENVEVVHVPCRKYEMSCSCKVESFTTRPKATKKNYLIIKDIKLTIFLDILKFYYNTISRPMFY